MAGHPLRPATDRSLGGPLPHQLANQTRAALKAINLSPEGHIRHYHPFPGAIPNLKARSHVLLTRPPLTPKGPFDLHVLGLPPAFALSQDQTLRLDEKFIPDWSSRLRKISRFDEVHPLIDHSTSDVPL